MFHQTSALLMGMLLVQSVCSFIFEARVYSFRTSLFSSMAEKVLENPKWPSEWPYSDQDFARMVRIFMSAQYLMESYLSLIFLCTHQRTKAMMPSFMNLLGCK
jgi:hypothetical protein